MAPRHSHAMPASPQPRGTSRRLAPALALLALVMMAVVPTTGVLAASAAAGTAKNRRKGGFADDTTATSGVAHQMTIVIGAIVGVLVGIIAVTVGTGILAGQLPSFFGSVGNITSAFTNANLGNAQLNTIVHSFAIIVGLLLILAPFGLIGGLVALSVVKHGKGGRATS